MLCNVRDISKQKVVFEFYKIVNITQLYYDFFGQLFTCFGHINTSELFVYNDGFVY